MCLYLENIQMCKKRTKCIQNRTKCPCIFKNNKQNNSETLNNLHEIDDRLPGQFQFSHEIEME